MFKFTKTRNKKVVKCDICHTKMILGKSRTYSYDGKLEGVSIPTSGYVCGECFDVKHIATKGE